VNTVDDDLRRVRICKGYAMIDSESGDAMPGGSIVAVPSDLANEWTAKGWATYSVESPGTGGGLEVAADGRLRGA
jgi:hypothetical protein